MPVELEVLAGAFWVPVGVWVVEVEAALEVGLLLSALLGSFLPHLSLISDLHSSWPCELSGLAAMQRSYDFWHSYCGGSVGSFLQ